MTTYLTGAQLTDLIATFPLAMTEYDPIRHQGRSATWLDQFAVQRGVHIYGATNPIVGRIKVATQHRLWLEGDVMCVVEDVPSKTASLYHAIDDAPVIQHSEGQLNQEMRAEYCRIMDAEFLDHFKPGHVQRFRYAVAEAGNQNSLIAHNLETGEDRAYSVFAANPAQQPKLQFYTTEGLG